MVDNKSFREAYVQMLVKSWTDSGFDARVEENPRAALAEVGIELPADAEVRIVRHAGNAESPYTEGGNEAALDAQTALFEHGQKTGKFEFHLPGAPATDEAVLNEEELAGISGGEQIPCCCCCC